MPWAGPWILSSSSLFPPRFYALGLEKSELKEIYQRGEATEKIYKKIFNMLSIQTERIEREVPQVVSAGKHFPIDGMERLVLIYKNEFITGKLFIMLSHEMEEKKMDNITRTD
ncbi:MAG: hypothetical protein ACR65O_00215 [Methylomicrobium sp.]